MSSSRITREQIVKLLATARSGSFEDVRDRAIMWMFIETDAEPPDITNLTENDIDLARGEVRLTDEHGTTRGFTLETEAARALADYVEARRRRPNADAGFWIDNSGAMDSAAVVGAARERGALAGLGDLLHPKHH